MENNNTAGIVRQLVYGSTPFSVGYSVLGKSPGLAESLLALLIERCESQDGQQYAVPPTPYSVSLFTLPNGLYVFREIFDGWQDQVGRPSRVMRCAVIDAISWDKLSGNPFLLPWLLPPIVRSLPRRRNEIRELAVLDLTQLTVEQWESLWWQATRRFLHDVARLSAQEQAFLAYLQQLPVDTTCEIGTERARLSLCQLLAYAMPVARRRQLAFDSFALNSKPAEGICFRYRPYCTKPLAWPATDAPAPEKLPLAWLIQTVTYAMSEPLNFAIGARLVKRRQRQFTVGLVVMGLLAILGILSRFFF